MSATFTCLQASPDQLADEQWVKSALIGDFKRVFSGENSGIRCFAAPARINLIGEHIDYNGGKVFPAALDRYLFMAVRKRSDQRIVVRNLQLSGGYERTIDTAGTGTGDASYAPYLDGVFELLRRSGLVVDTGFDILMFSTVPMGAGVSSSAALELCFARLLTGLFKPSGRNDFSTLELVQLAQQAEHQYAGVQCGIMDQFAVAFGRAGQAILLDTASLAYDYVPLELGDHCIVLMNSNFPRTLAGSKYNERREECMRALAQLQGKAEIRHLCDLSVAEFERLAPELDGDIPLRRARHCVRENDRVRRSVEALRAGDLAAFGKLMNESHHSLRYDYEVSGAALDALQDAAAAHPDCLGARMTGAGFGGCAIALVRRRAAQDFIDQVAAAYTAKTGLKAEFYITKAGDGARELA